MIDLRLSVGSERRRASLQAGFNAGYLPHATSSVPIRPRDARRAAVETPLTYMEHREVAMTSCRKKIEVQILDPRLREWGLPRYQTDMAAGVDLHACIDEPLVLQPQAPAVLVPSGMAVLMNDQEMAAIVLARSGLGHKKGLILGQSVGLIDADYTAQIFVSAWLRTPPGSETLTINPGDRIAQLVFVPIIRPELTFVDTLSATTARGGGGFGSTGFGTS